LRSVTGVLLPGGRPRGGIVGTIIPAPAGRGKCRLGGTPGAGRAPLPSPNAHDAAAQLEAGLVATGHGDEDVSALARTIRSLSGLDAAT